MKVSLPLGLGTLRTHSVRVVRRVLNACLPRECALCGTPSAMAFVCAPCQGELGRLESACPCCASPSPHAETCGECNREPPAFDATTAALVYAYPADRLLQRYKYGAALDLGGWFADLLVDALGSRHDVDLIVPMPLARPRLRERGFNQAHEIARRIGSRLAISVDPFAAARLRETAAQADLPISERARNVRGAFSATASVLGRRVAVVDDVMTTGATLNELARTLKRHGAARVENWVVARTLLQP